MFRRSGGRSKEGVGSVLLAAVQGSDIQVLESSLFEDDHLFCYSTRHTAPRSYQGIVLQCWDTDSRHIDRLAIIMRECAEMFASQRTRAD